MKIAVIGAGIMGASAARFIAEDGHDVTVFEQFKGGHSLGSSHGRSRIIRKAYPDAFYTSLLLEVFPMWRELEEQCGKLMHWTGLAYIGEAGHPELEQVRRSLSSLQVEFLQSPSVEGMRIKETECAIIAPEGGWVSADKALSAVHALLSRTSARVVNQRIDTLGDLESFDLVVIAAGAFVNHLVETAIRPTRQTFCYVRGRYDGPVWIEAESHLYGFPNEPGADSFKVAEHQPGPRANPGERFDPVEGQVQAVIDVCRRRFGIENPEIVEAGTCLYAYREGEDFIIDWLDRRTLLLSPCSGHGFKFSPWIGRLAADLVSGRRNLDGLERFRMPENS